jgi:hypothetical protein
MKAVRSALVVLLCGAALSAQKPLDLATLLDRYAAREIDAVATTVNKTSLKEINALRDQWPKDGEAWIKRGAKSARRPFVAAALALGIEVAVVEHGGWASSVVGTCRGRCVLKWAASQMAPKESRPDPAERAWWVAASALVLGTGNSFFLLDVNHEKESFLTEAVTRFPGDVDLKFIRAMVMSMPFIAALDGEPRSVEPHSNRTHWPREDVIKQWAALTLEDSLGLEASIRLAHLRWRGGEDGLALAELDRAIARAVKPDQVYLANLVAGLAARSAGDADRARQYFSVALRARPGSESASLALAAIELESERPDQAKKLIEGVGARGRDDDEPWRQFAYGPFNRMSELMARVRAEVR